MSSFYLKIAGITIAFKLHPTNVTGVAEKFFEKEIKYFYGGFLIKNPKKVDYYVDFIQKNTLEVLSKTNKKSVYIILYREISKRKIESYYHLSGDQFEILIRTIIQKFISKEGGIILHASSSEVKNRAQIFLGKSGTGKSTIVRILEKYSKPLSDDSIILKKDTKSFIFYQTPFTEKNPNIKKSLAKYDLGNFFILKKSNTNYVKKITGSKAIFNHLLKQLLTEKEDSGLQVNTLSELASKIDSIYYLYFSLKNPREVLKLINDEI